MTKAGIERLKRSARDSVAASNYKLWVHIDSVSQSGMSKKVSVYFTDKLVGGDIAIYQMNYTIGKIIGGFNEKSGNIMVRGCGFNVAQHVIERLSYELYGDRERIDYNWLR